VFSVIWMARAAVEQEGQTMTSKSDIPVSPDDSSTEMPRQPSIPIKLQTLVAYFCGTV